MHVLWQERLTITAARICPSPGAMIALPPWVMFASEAAMGVEYVQ